MILVAWTAFRLLFHFDRGETTVIAAVNTTFLWLRMINYLSGSKTTAPYVRMFTAITIRMLTFLIMMGIFVAGNCFVLLMLFPKVRPASKIRLSHADVLNDVHSRHWRDQLTVISNGN